VRLRFRLLIGLLGISLALGLPWAFLTPDGSESRERSVAAGANASALETSFAAWTADHDAHGGDRNVLFSLGWSKGLSREHSQARGLVRLDLLDGTAVVELRQLDPGEAWDIWMVDNQPGGSALPERGDKIQRLGRVTPRRGAARLAARLGRGFFDRFQADLVVVTRAGTRPEEAGVLFGSADLFQRLYTQRRTKPAPRAGQALAGIPSPFGPGVAFATPFDSLDPLVAKGADVFQNEKFNGNGRTCGSCHPARNNFTIDPKFIATLPASDPLFAAENNPDLAQNFENPTLLRELGLVLENPDGFDNLQSKFVLRGVPHTLAMQQSRTPQPGSAFEPIPPVERLGWGGDGAPGSGSLREFALGAITQHFTRRLVRTPGVDFRVPTDEELDAMAAFQLALGRQTDLDLPSIQFTSPIVRRGQTVYLTGDSAGGTVAAGKCNRCHFNGGSNVSVGNQNRNFDVGIEKLPNHPANLIQPGSLPVDGGFGTAVNANGGFGNGRFNSAVVVEAADTGPFFHNNAVQTIEEAVDFYNSAAFNNSAAGLGFKGQDTGGIGLHIETTDVESVAALLRVLNALENIRSSSDLDAAAAGKSLQQAKTLVELASFDTEDAFQVLEERSLHLVAVRKLKEAFVLERLVGFTPNASKRNQLIQKILVYKEQARTEMVRP
jgi:hypothetical protein